MRDLSQQHIRNAASFWSPFSSRHLDEFTSQKWPPKGFTFQFVQVYRLHRKLVCWKFKSRVCQSRIWVQILLFPDKNIAAVTAQLSSLRENQRNNGNHRTSSSEHQCSKLFRIAPTNIAAPTSSQTALEKLYEFPCNNRKWNCQTSTRILKHWYNNRLLIIRNSKENETMSFITIFLQH